MMSRSIASTTLAAALAVAANLPDFAHAQNGRHPVFEPAFTGKLPEENKSGAVNAFAASGDIRYLRDSIVTPGENGVLPAGEALRETCWRGERVNMQVVIRGGQGARQVSLATTPLTLEGGKPANSIPLTANFLRFTQAKGIPYGDIIDPVGRIDIAPGETRGVWIQTDIPAGAKPGKYSGAVIVKTPENPAGSRIPVELTVAKDVLPPATNWKFHLDLWQHPQAIARWHNVEPWSDDHFRLMKPYMKRLADMGQKTITCTILDEAWNAQTYDWFPSLIEWKRDAKGKFSWDFSRFAKWVKFMRDEVGIKGDINCYTMLPWHLQVKFFDEKTGTYEQIKLAPGTPEFGQVWGEFLTIFTAFLKKQGWLDKTGIALDERPDNQIEATLAVLKKHAPELRLVSAMDKPTKASEGVYDFSIILNHADSVTPEMLAARKAKGQLTTVYICVSPKVPNTFTHSPLAEAHWCPLFAAGNHFDGLLRWAYNSWNENPFAQTDFGNWPAGDCFLVYPGNLSSPQLERLRDGIEDFEKIRILREAAAKKGASPELVQKVKNLDAFLKQEFTPKNSAGTGHAKAVQAVRAMINP